MCARCSLTPPAGFPPPSNALSEPLLSICRTPHGLIRFPVSEEGRARICICNALSLGQPGAALTEVGMEMGKPGMNYSKCL